MKELYSQQGKINIIKHDKENILRQGYKIDDSPEKKHIHISIAFNDKNIDNYIKHIASILHHADKEKSFIHIHMLDAGEFNYDSFNKISKMTYNINNSTEIIVYNVNTEIKSFNMRPDRAEKFPEEYAKLCTLKVLKDIQKVILLNGNNIMVEKDLGELYDLKMDNISI